MLEVKTNLRYQCPIKPEACDDMRLKYSLWLGPYELPKVISPDCRWKPSPEWANLPEPKPAAF
jgi:hypothetical protein